MRLSERLETIISMAEQMPGNCRVADVGTDHGFVPIRLVKDGLASYALAMDVREGPLLRAREHIEKAGLADRIETRLSDGLAALGPGEADGVVITGMGGELMLRILRDGGHVRNFVKWWVLSPQSEPELFRRGLEELGLAICRETMLEEEGKFYTVMLVKPGNMHYEKRSGYRYGDYLIRCGSPVLRTWLLREKSKLQDILVHLEKQLEAEERRQGGMQKRDLLEERRQELLEELKEIGETYDAMQGIDGTL